MYATWAPLIVGCVVVTSGCDARPASESARMPAGSVAASRDSIGAASLLIPAVAGIDRVSDLMRDPALDSFPEPHRAAMVRRGLDIMRDTRTNAAAYAGNDLSCTNCHLNSGQKDGAFPLVGVASLFPEYRARSGRLITLEDRIRDCFARSLNGKAPPFDSDELIAVSAYITWLGTDMPAGRAPPWRGGNQIAKDARIPIEKLDAAAGRSLFERACVACHGTDGQGVKLGEVKPGPLWGPRSWNDGAGAARVYTLAGFIRYAMPLTAPGSLSDADAQNIAAYIESHERPRFAHKDADYPDGKIPVDAVYDPRKYATNPLVRR